ncbi:ATP-binding protein [Vibrio cholerae]|uniref:ATP-binding protein n=1 Tax=Vibrio cholerae TaxID=666 RepID=UPI0006E67E30|nr:ATP-binding protein [Vibrio cholerae]EHS4948514.1 response regulator [Vibrio cholerae]EKY3318171.1 response regulator [Vibrio cholerae]ELL3750542.1 response regulator [Vibrio cholerae]KQA49493.1 histidine kinase [Vibrio cholerae]KQA59364.1 histidine kinase [Vibrio cholerae]
MDSEYTEKVNELTLELQRSIERGKQLAEENRVILAAISAFSVAINKNHIFEELKTLLNRYIQFDDFIVISKDKNGHQFRTAIASNASFNDVVWPNGVKFQRVLNGECILLFEPCKLDEFACLMESIEKPVYSALITGIQAQISDSVLILLGQNKGQFSLEAKETLSRFRPLLERAISDIEHKEELQKLVEIRTRELRLAQKLAEQANQSKSNFLAMMSHELRTPLNAVLGLIDILRGESTSYQVELLEQMENSAELLLIIINDILDLSRIESGHFSLHCHWLDLEKKLDQSLVYHRQIAQDKGVHFYVQSNKNPTLEYYTDSARLTQILFNIVGNAIKFTKQGQVDVVLDYTKDGVVFRVKDTGIGIEKNRVEQLFTPFIQADNSITRNYGGTGLGLAITKHLVELMGGTIQVESEFGIGTTFTLYIPLQSRLKNIKPSTSSSQQVVNVKNHHILVVEDTKTNQMVIQLLLNKLGYDVTIAENGLQAVELLERNHAFDLVLMDISMPIMDGIAATKILRDKHIEIPIIALTAHTAGSDKQNCIDAGMNDIVLKPIRSKDIMEVVKRFLNP